MPIRGSKEAGRVLAHCRPLLDAFGSAIIFNGTALNHAATAYRFERKSNGGKGVEEFAATAHVYLNRATRAADEQRLQEMLHGILDEFGEASFGKMEDAAEWLADKAGRGNAKFFRLAGTAADTPPKHALSKDGAFRLSVDEAEYADAVAGLGIFMILNSNPAADGMDTLADNRSRDCQEKIFDIFKNSTGNDRLKVSTDATLHGRLFLAFIAVILRKAVENELRRADLLKTTSVNKALDLARKFNVMLLGDGRKLPLEVPRKSRIIFEAVAPGLLKRHGIAHAAAAPTAKKL